MFGDSLLPDMLGLPEWSDIVNGRLWPVVKSTIGCTSHYIYLDESVTGTGLEYYQWCLLELNANTKWIVS